MIHALVEVIVMAVVILYFQKKMSNIVHKLNELQKIVHNQQIIINRHEKMLSQIFGTSPPPPMMQDDFINEPISPIHNNEINTNPSTSPNISNISNVMPMVTSLLGMLGTVGGGIQPPTVEEKPHLEEVDIDKELVEELEELKEDGRADEGRIEETKSETSEKSKDI
jgi:hypothetical protein